MTFCRAPFLEVDGLILVIIANIDAMHRVHRVGGRMMRLTVIALAVASIGMPVPVYQAGALRASAIASAGVPSERPAVGDLFEPPETTAPDLFQWRFRGWRYVGRGDALGLGRFVIFTDEHSYIIAATEVAMPSRDAARDGIQRIVATKLVAPSPGEKLAVSCDFVTLSPVLAFYARDIARGFFVVGSEIVERRWFTDGDCYDNPD